MKRTGEILTFAVLALAAHLAFWSGFARTGSESAGAGGAATVSLMAATGDLVDLVEAWSRPVEVLQSIELPDMTQSLEASAALSTQVNATESARSEAEEANEAPSQPETPAPLPQIDKNSLRPEVALAAPQSSLRPVSRSSPAASKQQFEKPNIEERSTAGQSTVAPQQTGALAQTAAGNKTGQNAGNRDTQVAATLSSSARQNLLAQWGAAIRNRVERRKYYPSGTRAKGTTLLRVKLTRMGDLVSVSVTRSSGTAMLDTAAIGAVKGARFPSAPNGLKEPTYIFNLPLAFQQN
ncbi:MAG: TonB family protein [Pseudomonadota bacterium]